MLSVSPQARLLSGYLSARLSLNTQADVIGVIPDNKDNDENYDNNFILEIKKVKSKLLRLNF
jgi:hypothetical protein